MKKLVSLLFIIITSCASGFTDDLSYNDIKLGQNFEEVKQQLVQSGFAYNESASSRDKSLEWFNGFESGFKVTISVESKFGILYKFGIDYYYNESNKASLHEYIEAKKKSYSNKGFICSYNDAYTSISDAHCMIGFMKDETCETVLLMYGSNRICANTISFFDIPIGASEEKVYHNLSQYFIYITDEDIYTGRIGRLNSKVQACFKDDKLTTLIACMFCTGSDDTVEKNEILSTLFMKYGCPLIFNEYSANEIYMWTDLYGNVLLADSSKIGQITLQYATTTFLQEELNEREKTRNGLY